MKPLATFEDLNGLLSTKRLVVIVYGASWCIPYVAVHPLLLSLENRLARSDIAFGYVDADVNEGKLMIHERVGGMPAFRIYVDGKLEVRMPRDSMDKGAPFYRLVDEINRLEKK